MISAFINGHHAYIHRVERFDSKGKGTKSLADQFKDAITSAMSLGVKIEHRYPAQSAVCQCGKIFMLEKTRAQCFECQPYERTRSKAKYTPNVNGSPDFTCPYCATTTARRRENQATCTSRECRRLHNIELQKGQYIKKKSGLVK